MTDHDPNPQTLTRTISLRGIFRRVICWHLGWIFPILVFLLLRYPAMVHQPGMQDEHWFSVPGLTVLRDGVPRIPYVPTRQRETFFENADVCLMALPPGLFYVQAPFFAFLEPGYPTARVPLLLGACLAICLTFLITERLMGKDRSFACCVSTVAALLVAVSRPLLFTGLTVRPDLLCIGCGWIAILVLWKRWPDDVLRSTATCGAICGLGGLFHPFALVFCIQAGLATLLKPITWKRRVLHAVVLTISAIAVLSLWLPLIIHFPDEFRSQFFANVLDRAGPGLPSRLINPVDSLLHHATLIWEFAGPWQTGISVFGLLVGSVVMWQSRYRRDTFPHQTAGYLVLAWSSVYLTATVAGLHPTKGYWVYTFVWLMPMVVVACWELSQRLIRKLSGAAKNSRVCFAVVACLALAMMIPQSGLRTTWLYITRWGNSDLHGRRFIKNVLAELPEEGIFYADLSYVFDVYLSGRQTRLAQEKQMYWGPDKLDYEYLILSWEGEDADWAKQYDGQFVKRIGSRTYDQSCFVDLYQSPDALDPNALDSDTLDSAQATAETMDASQP